MLLIQEYEQSSPSTVALHPNFFSRKLTPTEQNYSVGDRTARSEVGSQRMAPVAGGFCTTLFLWSELSTRTFTTCWALGANVSLSSGFHPQTNGQTERANQELEAALYCVVMNSPASLSQYLPILSPNTTATIMSPFKASMGYQPPLFSLKNRNRSRPFITTFAGAMGCGGRPGQPSQNYRA